MEYPVIECKEANITFWNTFFPLIFAYFFGFPDIVFPIVMIKMMPETAFIVIPVCVTIALIGIGALIISLRSIFKYIKVMKYGKEIEATVYGYMNDNVLLNNEPAQIVKLKVETAEGPRFILYQLGDIKQPYKINSKIKLLVYKDIFMLKKEEKKYYFE